MQTTTIPKINFVANCFSGDDIEELRLMKWEDGIRACVTQTWVWPLYCRLKMRGFDVSINYKLQSNAVNIIHGQVARMLLTAKDFYRYYIIGIRADYRRFPYGQYEVVQNMHFASERKPYMPLFTQPGLIPRNPMRQTIENVCFAGEIQNSIGLAEVYDEAIKLGCQIIHKGVGQWHDMSDVDILLGIRSFSRRPYHSKPPTKLLNAWLAGIPFIGGYDSAYSQVGLHGVNYIRVSSCHELVEAIQRLKEDTHFYNRLVSEGFKAVAEFTPDTIVDRWIHFFNQRVVLSHDRWRKGRINTRSRDLAMGMFFAASRSIHGNVRRILAPRYLTKLKMLVKAE